MKAIKAIVYYLNLVMVGIALMLISGRAQASLIAEIQGTYINDAVQATKPPSLTNNFGNSTLGFTIDSNGKLSVGFGYTGFTTNYINNGTNDTLQGYDLGPFVKFEFGEKRLFSILGMYGVQATAAYIQPTGTDTWSGTSYLGSFSYQPALTEHLRIAAGVTYYYAFYTTQVLSKTNSGVSNSRAMTTPTLGLILEF